MPWHAKIICMRTDRGDPSVRGWGEGDIVSVKQVAQGAWFNSNEKCGPLNAKVFVINIPDVVSFDKVKRFLSYSPFVDKLSGFRRARRIDFDLISAGHLRSSENGRLFVIDWRDIEGLGIIDKSLRRAISRMDIK